MGLSPLWTILLKPRPDRPLAVWDGRRRPGGTRPDGCSDRPGRTIAAGPGRRPGRGWRRECPPRGPTARPARSCSGRRSPSSPTSIQSPCGSAPRHSRSRSGTLSGTSENRAAGATPITWQTPSRAMWRMLATHGSWVASVGATQMSTPWAYIAKRASGMKFSQQMRPPIRPTAVWWTCRSDPSPMPHTSRSACVGISLRCLPSSRPSVSKYRIVL